MRVSTRTRVEAYMVVVADPLDRSLARAVRQVRTSSGLPVAFAGRVDDRCLRISQLAGNRSPSLLQLALAPGTGLGGRALTLRRPASVSDYACAAAITHEYDAAVADEGLRAIVAVPVVARGDVVAVLYAAARSAMRIGDRVVDSLMSVGREVSRDAPARPDPTPPSSELQVSELLASAQAATRRCRRSDVREIVEALHEHAAGVSDPDLRASLLRTCDRLRAAVDGGSADDHRVRLSPRQRDALELVALGCSDAEIAEQLTLDLTTVRGAVRTLRRMFGVHSRQGAVCAARAAGVL